MKLSDLTKLNALLDNTGDMALKRRARKIIEGIEPEEGDRILDVGCGDGYYLHLLSNLHIKNLKLTGIDNDENGLKSARRNLHGKKISLVKGDLMEKLPFRSNYFDKVIMSEVAEHLPSDIKGLKEIKRVLKKDGILALTVPNHNYPMFWDPVNWFSERLFNTHIRSGFWAGIWNQHIRLYKPNEIEKVVKKSGFRIKDVVSLTFWCLPFNHNIVNIVARILVHGNLSENNRKSLSKYETGYKKTSIIGFLFKMVNLLDILNDIYQPKDIGVGVFVLAEKP